MGVEEVEGSRVGPVGGIYALVYSRCVGDGRAWDNARESSRFRDVCPNYVEWTAREEDGTQGAALQGPVVRHPANICRLEQVHVDWQDLTDRLGIDAMPSAMPDTAEERRRTRFFTNVFYPWTSRPLCVIL